MAEATLDNSVDGPGGGTPPGGVQGGGIDGQLRVLAAQARAQLLIQRAGMILASLLAVAFGWGILDYWLRFPSAVRWVAFGIGLAVAGVHAWRRLAPVWMFKPSATQMALRIESALPADAGLKRVLASGLELDGRAEGKEALGAVEESLRRSVSRAAKARFPSARARTRLLNPAGLVRALVALLAILVPLVGLRVGQPTLTRIGTLRVLAPWVEARWPKRTGVVDANPLIAHALGAPIALRAVSFRGGEDGSALRIEYRVVNGSEPTPWRRAMLSRQNKRISVERPGGGDPVEGPLHELLLETAPLVTPGPPGSASRVVLEYRFLSADDETPVWTTLLVPPPSVTRADVTVTPPEYASACSSGVGSAARLIQFTTPVGSSVSSNPRVRAGIALAGSAVELRLHLSRPLAVPASEGDLAEALAVTFPALGDVPGLRWIADDSTTAEVEGKGSSHWTLRWIAWSSISTPISLRDSFGIHATTDPLFDLEVIDDGPPRPAVIEPAQDESILATAVVPVTAESRDDVGVATLSLRFQPEKQPEGSPGAPAEAVGEPVEVAANVPGECAPRAECGGILDIAQMGLVAGDALVLTAHSTDLRLASLSQLPVVSAPRRLRIISESSFAEELQNELASMRDAAARLRKEQGEVSAQSARAAASPESAADTASRQAAVAERIEPLRRLSDRLKARIERNRPGDSALGETVEDADELADQAAVAAEAAAESLQELSMKAGGRSDTQPSREALARETADQQAAVETALDELVSMLDQGREGHAARRAIERLLTEQRQTTAQTANAASQSQGEAVESLSSAERQELERLSARQESLSQRTRTALDSLEQQSEELKAADPGQAKAMESAARKGRESRAAAQQQKASEQIQQNQTGQAQQNQKQAEAALEEMLEELNRTQERRDEALRRVLAEISEELDRLVVVQTAQLALASAALSSAPAAPIDSGMITLSRSTIAVNARIRKEVRAAGDLPALLDSAVNAQSAAVASLRTEPADYVDAVQNEQRSLSRLRAAVEELARLEAEADEKEQDRKRRELLKEYQESLETQAAINAEVAPFVGRALARKDRAALRFSAETQNELRLALLQLREETSEMDSARMFAFAHDRLDASMTIAATGLKAGTAEPPVNAAQTSSLRILASLVEALRPANDEDDGLREDEQAADAGGGGGAGQEPPLIPPIAELKLLRAMQLEAFELTRLAGEAGEAGDSVAVSVAAELQSALAARAAEIQEALEKEDSAPPLELKEAEPKNDPLPPAPVDGPIPPGPAFQRHSGAGRWSAPAPARLAVRGCAAAEST